MPHPAWVVVPASPYDIELQQLELPALQLGEVTVRIAYAALNRRDEWIRQGKYPGIQAGTVPGSDGAGEVVAVADDVAASWLGRQVLLNPNINWGPDPAAQAKDYTILGMPHHGTLQAFLNVPAHRLHTIPTHLTLPQAAALPLAGLTAYRATFTKGDVGPGKRVLVTGIGGGVAQLAALFAIAAGAEVWVSTSDDKKGAHFLSNGAKGVANYRVADWAKQLKAQAGGFHTIIDSAGGDDINTLIDLALPAGRVIFYGATLGKPTSLNVQKMFWNQLRLEGSTMGNDHEFAQMLVFVAEKGIAPIVDSVRPMAEAKTAFDALKSGTQFGKLVILIA